MCLAVSKVWKCMYVLKEIPITEEGVKTHMHRVIRNRPNLHFFLFLWLLHMGLT